MRSDLDTYRAAATEPVGLRPGADTRMYTTGVLLEIDDTTRRAFVSVNDSSGSWLPYLPGVYEGVRTVLVALNPFEGGRAQWVLGPAEDAPDDPAEDPLPQEPPSAPADSVSQTVTVTPQWSGTWRVPRSAWDRWNTTSYGGRSDVYQGSGYGSGTLRGLAVYGNQLVNLGASSIDAVVLRVRRNGSGGGTAALGVQGSPHGSKPSGSPASSGATAATPAVAPGAWTEVALPSAMREALRTGSAKGLVAVGSTYSGWYGTGGSFALRVTYTRPN